MSTFQDTRADIEQKVMVHLFTEIERNPSFTQRTLAKELNIALGLINQYLKRCLAKGWIRGSEVSVRRMRYFLTPEGFKEKSQMVQAYLARSLSFFKDAKTQCEQMFTYCHGQGWARIALVGPGDLADIARIVVLKYSTLAVDIVSMQDDLHPYDAVLVTDVLASQETYDTLKSRVDSQRLLCLDLLHISKVRV